MTVRIDFTDDEFRALRDVWKHAPLVNWEAYDAAKRRILSHARSQHVTGSHADPDEETPV